MAIESITKDTLLRLLRRGLVTEAEAGRIAGTTRQNIGKLAERAGIDSVAARQAYLANLISRMAKQ